MASTAHVRETNDLNTPSLSIPVHFPFSHIGLSDFPTSSASAPLLLPRHLPLLLLPRRPLLLLAPQLTRLPRRARLPLRRWPVRRSRPSSSGSGAGGGQARQSRSGSSGSDASGGQARRPLSLPPPTSAGQARRRPTPPPRLPWPTPPIRRLLEPVRTAAGGEGGASRIRLRLPSPAPPSRRRIRHRLSSPAPPSRREIRYAIRISPRIQYS